MSPHRCLLAPQPTSDFVAGGRELAQRQGVELVDRLALLALVSHRSERP
jgi:hypothetical protein